MDVMPASAEPHGTDMAPPPQAQQQLPEQGPSYDETGRMINQLGGHNVVISPRTYAPSSAGPLPAPDFCFGSVGRENNEVERSNDVSGLDAKDNGAFSMEDSAHSRTATEGDAPLVDESNYQQTNIKPEA